MKKFSNFIQKVRKEEKKLNAFQYHFVVLVFLLIIYLLFKLSLQIDIFVYNEKLHLLFGDAIGWVITITFGLMIFVTLTIDSLKNVHYKNVSALKYFLEARSELDAPFYFFETNMSARNDIITIMALNILLIIFYYFKLDFILLFSGLYELFVLISLVLSSINNIQIERANKLYQIALSEYINSKTLDDLKHTHLKNFGSRIDFDINLLFAVHKFIVEKNYIKLNINDRLDEFKQDTDFLKQNMNYIFKNNKMEFVASYYNLELYSDTILSYIIKSKILNEKETEWLKLELKTLKDNIEFYLRGKNVEKLEWYNENYKNVINIIELSIEKMK